MHGLVNKAFQSFLIDTFGASSWQAILGRAGLWDEIGTEGFDPLHTYPDSVTPAILRAATEQLGRPADQLLEDLGTWLVSNPRTEGLRRLLRFGGLTYANFLRSLDDLQGRARLAVPDLTLPALMLQPAGEGRFVLTCLDCPEGFGLVMVGILRAMADDYGALVVLHHQAQDPTAGAPRCETVMIDLLDASFHAGRAFDLALAGAGLP